MKFKQGMVDQLIVSLESYGRISPQIKEVIFSLITCRKLKSGACVLKEGDLCENLFFLNSGLLRAHYLSSSGNDITSSFVQENEFFTNVTSFSTLGYSTETISVLEDSVYCCIKQEDYKKLIYQFPELSLISHAVINKHRIELDERIRMLQNLKAKGKLLVFEKNYPNLTGRVQNGHIASFIGVALETFSRIKHSKTK